MPRVGQATHGQHNRLRAPGSIGAASYPARVFKGMRMAGQMGKSKVKVSKPESYQSSAGEKPPCSKRMCTWSQKRIRNSSEIMEVNVLNIEGKETGRKVKLVI